MRHYTNEEEAYIKANHKRMSIKKMAEHIGRTDRSVYKKIKLLGINEYIYGDRRRSYTNQEDKIINELWETHTCEEIAAKLNRSRHSIYQRGIRLCLEVKRKRYVAYRGSKFLCEGTVEECAQAAGVKKEHIWRLLTPKYQELAKQYKETENRLVVYRLDKEELA